MIDKYASWLWQQVPDPSSVHLSTGRPDSVDNKSVIASTMVDHQLPQLPPALLRLNASRTGVCPGPGRTAASSTPRGRALEVGAGRWRERPDSALSNFSELDSGYDELRSFAVTPIIPPELVITAPQDRLPAEMTSSLVGSEPEDGGRHGKRDDDDDYEANKSISVESDLGRSEAFPEDRCNTSSVIEQEELLLTNTGTGNSSAVSLSSLDAADGCRLSANNSQSKLSWVESSKVLCPTGHILDKVRSLSWCILYRDFIHF